MESVSVAGGLAVVGRCEARTLPQELGIQVNRRGCTHHEYSSFVAPDNDGGCGGSRGAPVTSRGFLESCRALGVLEHLAQDLHHSRDDSGVRELAGRAVLIMNTASLTAKKNDRTQRRSCGKRLCCSWSCCRWPL